ncbi:MAG: hypothetical protein CL521_03855 [Actinobacteria bacterium]|nr:hypothetical protein [Actinomycetota bacterium]|tara:strand:+ start:83 stop:460 length:378 start_codon:yes stop_codon:yes gene_type:complete
MTQNITTVEHLSSIETNYKDLKNSCQALKRQINHLCKGQQRYYLTNVSTNTKESQDWYCVVLSDTQVEYIQSKGKEKIRYVLNLTSFKIQKSHPNAPLISLSKLILNLQNSFQALSKQQAFIYQQ